MGMTRETKISLIVGLVLILVIGIVVSDHLTVTNRPAIPSLVDGDNPAPEAIPQHIPRADTSPDRFANRGATSSQPPAVADLPAIEHIQPRHQRESETRSLHDNVPVPAARIERETPANSGHNAAARALDALSGGSQFRQEQRVESQSADVDRIRPAQPDVLIITSDRNQPRRTYHTVKPNESLSIIADQYYNDQTKWTLIRDANPNKLMRNSGVRVGVRLVIPPLPESQDTTTAGTTTSAPPTPTIGRVTTTTPPAATDVIIVKPGDTLGQLAQRYLGSTAHEDKLFEANRDKLRSKDQIYVGMKLRRPTGFASTVTPRPSITTPSSAKTYRVQKNDTLYRIAQRKLGNGEKWREIYDLNRDTLASPSNLEVGQQLRLP